MLRTISLLLALLAVPPGVEQPGTPAPDAGPAIAPAPAAPAPAGATAHGAEDPQLQQSVLRLLEEYVAMLKQRAEADQKPADEAADAVRAKAVLVREATEKMKTAHEAAVEKAKSYAAATNDAAKTMLKAEVDGLYKTYGEQLAVRDVLIAEQQALISDRDAKLKTSEASREKYEQAREVLQRYRDAIQNMQAAAADGQALAAGGPASPAVPEVPEDVAPATAGHAGTPSPPGEEAGSAEASAAVEPLPTEVVAKPEIPCDPIDAFRKLPLVTPLAAAEKLAEFQDVQGDDPTQLCETCPTYVLDYRFDAAAQFPLAQFGLNGERFEQPGAVIYEGMRFAVRPDGRYQVRFLMETPAMPVTVRLQLLLEVDENRYTLSLPPISIPEPEQREFTALSRRVPPVHAKVQTIHQEGYLPVLAAHPGVSSVKVVRRTGTARFGFGVDVP